MPFLPAWPPATRPRTQPRRLQGPRHDPLEQGHWLDASTSYGLFQRSARSEASTTDTRPRAPTIGPVTTPAFCSSHPPQRRNSGRRRHPQRRSTVAPGLPAPVGAADGWALHDVGAPRGARASAPEFPGRGRGARNSPRAIPLHSSAGARNGPGNRRTTGYAGGALARAPSHTSELKPPALPSPTEPLQLARASSHTSELKL